MRVQSMVNRDPSDAGAVAAQMRALADAGAEIVRLTVPDMRVARSLASLVTTLRSAGYAAAIAADCHFSPDVAIEAAGWVDKVRINPGNYAGGKTSRAVQYTDEEYAEELERVRKRFLPLVGILSKGRRALRIGVNHGSLSGRILSRFGDTPEGMVESALEFARPASASGYHDIIISLKASDPAMMVRANRLLVAAMIEEGMDYPIHLGVTEAGIGEEAFVRSAVGIGTLLIEGIGDTIRVSVSGDPLDELPYARAIAALAGGETAAPGSHAIPAAAASTPFISGEEGSPGEGSLRSIDPVRDITPGEFVTRHRELASSGRDILIRYLLKEDSLAEIALCAAAAGSLLIDGIGEGLSIEGPVPEERRRALAEEILAASGRRRKRVEIIACPTCGRAGYDVAAAAAGMREAAGDLPPVRIGVMGCIVNGPGEMTGADYGIVGAGEGRVNLYRGPEIVEKGIPEAKAVGALLRLIRSERGGA